MQKASIETLIQFQLLDSCVLSGNQYYHFFRYYPPNTDIMTPQEIDNEIDNFSSLLNVLDREICLFATDK